MQNLKIALIAVTTSLFLSACSSVPLVETVVVEAPRPELIIPDADQLSLRNAEYIIITEDNVQEVFAELEASGTRIVIFGLTADGYEAMSLNVADIIKLIEQQKSIIAAYEQYYEAETQ